jgi:inosine/xanthosine triphosphate pyrophosphatase family protein
MKKLLIATNNPGKQKQFRYLFKDRAGLALVFPRDIGLAGTGVAEDGRTAKENAQKKARVFAEKSKLPTLADDGGVEIDALDGEPGVQARRWNGLFPEDVEDEVWLEYLLKRMKDVPQDHRGGKVRAHWVAVLPGGAELDLEIIRPFYLVKVPQRPYPKGLPLSALEFNIKHGKMVKDLKDEEIYDDLKEQLDQWSEFWDAMKKK